MSDHKADALGTLGHTSGDNPNFWSIQWAIEAQVHATLYLAEQQRVANLIAVAALNVGINDLNYAKHLIDNAAKVVATLTETEKP